MDKVIYLNRDPAGGPFFNSRLIQLLRESKQAKAPPSQWLGFIKGLSQKGVKGAEVEDSAVQSFLEAADPKAPITKEDLIAQVTKSLCTIKEVQLGSPQYGTWRHAGGNYMELLYILNSERSNVEDDIEAVRYEMEQLGFDPTPIIEDPGIVDRLERQLATLKAGLTKATDFTAHHFSNAVKEHGKNLMAHARVTERGPLFFVEEVQSDWAQKGRRYDWNAQYPRAPFVTQTDLWAGLVLRRLMQRAALDPGVKQFAWITASMRNGGRAGGNDDLAEFYARIIPKLAEKTIGGAGGKVSPREVSLDGVRHLVYGFDMTPEVRKVLTGILPLYSHGQLMRTIPTDHEARRAEVLRESAVMLGNARAIRFASHVFDIASGREVAGRYVNRGIEISLHSKSMSRAARHEVWHFADENLLYSYEREMIARDFGLGTEYNARTREALLALGERASASQCSDPAECAAHAFSLWAEGKLSLPPEAPATGIFADILEVVRDIRKWLISNVFGRPLQTAEELFVALRDGDLAARARQDDQARSGRTVYPSPGH